MSLRARRAAAWSVLLLAGCASPLEQTFGFSGDAPSRTGLVPIGEGALFANEAGRVMRLGPDGALLWTAELVHEVRAAPAVAGETVVAATVSGDVVGLDAGTGVRRWRTELSGSAAALAAADGRAFLLSDEGDLLALEAATGLAVWRSALGSGLGIRAGAAPRLALLLVPGGGLVAAGPGALLAVSAEDGTRRWRAPVHEPFGLLVQRGLLWTVDGSGRALAFAPATGELRSERALGRSPTSPLGQALDRLWVGLEGNVLVGFRPGDDAPPWTGGVPGPVVAPVVELEGRVLVPTAGREGRLLAIDVGAPGNPPSARVDSPLRTAPLVRRPAAWVLAQDGRVLGFRLRPVGGSGR
ncbi:MAG TPA: PQQ-binding-like beta-propeller repeat protein [Myxococcaceae bacterium]|nr:PQQ-binding-like beta-propeller repeat protein [Myxococcaceae bacterium]